MSVKLLTEHLLEFLSLKGGFTGSSESTLVKMPQCWKSHVTAHTNQFSIFHAPKTGFIIKEHPITDSIYIRGVN